MLVIDILIFILTLQKNKQRLREIKTCPTHPVAHQVADRNLSPFAEV